MMTNDIGTITHGNGFSLSGYGENYASYTWKASSEFTSGIINLGQSFTNLLPEVPQPLEPTNGINEVPINLDFAWSSALYSNSYTLEIATDEEFTNVIYLGTEIIDTTQRVENLVFSQIYYWRILAENGNGVSQYSDVWNFSTTVTGIDNIVELPKEFALNQNFPNPFNPTTIIGYTIPQMGEIFSEQNVKLTIYDVLGKEVKTLVNEFKSAGKYEITFDASNLTSGVYYYQLKVGEFIETRKMSLLK
jgi:hypothetical protein